MSLRTTFVLSSDFHGLLVQVVTYEKVLSYNPFSKNFSWVGSKTAEYLILNREFPYQNCGQFTAVHPGCGESKVAQVASFMMWNEKKDKYFRILEHLLNRGEDINGRSNADSYTSLHTAIVSQDPKLVSYLLERGADEDIDILPNGRRGAITVLELVEKYSREDEPNGVAMKKAFEQAIKRRDESNVDKQIKLLR